jgi:hypothetical protein
MKEKGNVPEIIKKFVWVSWLVSKTAPIVSWY